VESAITNEFLMKSVEEGILEKIRVVTDFIN
jgi:hypothetical protein